MLRPESLAGLGLFVVRGFFDPAECRAVRAEIASTLGALGSIHKEGSEGEFVDPGIRSVGQHTVSSDTYSRIINRFEAVRPVLSQHFGLALEGFEELKFLRYKSGDFYLPHLDAAEDAKAPVYMRDRKVSVVLFLN